eukprot:COSAG01_NODE_7466_length_3199_cov_3.514839_4_plen_120_part_00
MEVLRLLCQVVALIEHWAGAINEPPARIERGEVGPRPAFLRSTHRDRGRGECTKLLRQHAGGGEGGLQPQIREAWSMRGEWKPTGISIIYAYQNMADQLRNTRTHAPFASLSRWSFAAM